MRDIRSVRPNVQGKAVTREATREAKLKRGGMKERFERVTWCLHLMKERLGRELCYLVVAFDAFDERVTC